MFAGAPRGLRSSGGPREQRLGGAILEELGAPATAEESQGAAAQPRAWTHLVTTYGEVQRGGLFLFARDRGDERFSLFPSSRQLLSSQRARS